MHLGLTSCGENTTFNVFICFVKFHSINCLSTFAIYSIVVCCSTIRDNPLYFEPTITSHKPLSSDYNLPQRKICGKTISLRAKG